MLRTNDIFEVPHRVEFEVLHDTVPGVDVELRADVAVLADVEVDTLVRAVLHPLQVRLQM